MGGYLDFNLLLCATRHRLHHGLYFFYVLSHGFACILKFYIYCHIDLCVRTNGVKGIQFQSIHLC
jgi:hypothetical protein